jgi:hypothetical protein
MTTSETDEQWTDSGRGTTLKGLVALPVFAFLWLVHLLSPLWTRWRDKAEAQAELQRLVAEQELRSYDDLRQLVGRQKHLEFTTAAGHWYQATVEVLWDDEPGGAIRVAVSIDDGGTSAFHPMSYGTLVDPPAAIVAGAVEQGEAAKAPSRRHSSQ